MKKQFVVYVAEVKEIGERRTPRSCAVCCLPATKEVMRARKGRAPVLATLRFACDDHATLENMYPVTVRVKLVALPPRRGYQTPKGDQSMFYRDVMREMGGEVPMPDKVTKEELAADGKRLARRHNNWPVAGVPGSRFVKPYQRRYRPAGMSGR